MITLDCRIENGKLSTNKIILKNLLAQEKNGKYELKITKPTRGSEQNRYYWGIPIKLITDKLKDLGNDIDELDTHEYLKGKFNRKILIVNDEEQIIGATTTKLKYDEFEEYIKKIQRWASETLDLYISDRGEFPE